MKKIWRVRSGDRPLRERIAGSLNISEVTSQLLINRGAASVDDARAFLTISISSCHDPFLMKDMSVAVERIKRAVSAGERICIFGDYDVDGMTSAALMRLALKRLGADATVYIPNRIEEGYGMNAQAIRRIHEGGVTLIISVDCGITAFREVDIARGLGIDVIITDHHEVSGSRVPESLAVINPHQRECAYPFKHLAGVGVAFKLAQALFEGSGHSADEYLDLVGLGTVADISPLVGENRVLSKLGLKSMSARKRVGLTALMDVAGLGSREISTGHVGFALGPRINAMGRIGSPMKALELLLTEDREEARRLAKVLDTENRTRQKMESRILEDAFARIEREVNFKHHHVIVLANESWHPGIIGIVASRIVDRYQRPAILISLDGKYGKGSGRGIDGFHLFEHLFECREYLVGFGGHEAACGLTIEKSKIDAFRDRLNEVAAKAVASCSAVEYVDIDAEVSLGALTEASIAEMDMLAPFGQENPEPVLATYGVVVKDGPRPIGKRGIKMWVTEGATTCEAVSFASRDMPALGTDRTIDLAYTPSINEWQGVRSIQLDIQDMR